MSPAQAHSIIIDALQHATASVLDPAKYREALNAAITLQTHSNERNRKTIEVLGRCESMFGHMNKDLLMRGPEMDSVLKLAEELEEEAERQRTILKLEANTTERTHGPDFWLGDDEPSDEPSYLVPIYIWGRDCDQCESDRITWILPDLETFTKLVANTYEDAEGPTSIAIMTPEEAAKFQPTRRDRVMEAFENGNTTGVVL